MPKQANKDIRQPVQENPLESRKKIRPKIGRSMQLDVSLYVRKHPDKKLMLITEGKDLHFWLDNGAEPVPRATDAAKTYKGINDKFESEYVSFAAGTNSKNEVYRQYLLMIDPELYEEMKTGPERDRLKEIEDAMRLGANQSDIAGHLPGGGGVQTYAPNLPVGDGQGYNQIRPNR